MARPTVRILSRYLLRQHLAPLGFALAAFTLLMLLRQVAQQFGNLVGKGLPWSVILEVVERQFFLRAARIDPATNRLRDVTIYDLGDPERRRIISADSGRMAYTPGGRDLYLTLLDGDIREVNRSDPTQFDRTLYVVNKIRVQNVGNSLGRGARPRQGGPPPRGAPRPITPAILPGQPLPPRGAPVPWLATGATVGEEQRVRAARQRAASYEVEIHKKYAIAAACIAFALVGIPVALRFPRGGVGLLLATGLIVDTVYYVGLIGGEELGDRLFVSPFFAMRTPNLLFSALGLAGLWAVRRPGDAPQGGDWTDLFRTFLPRRRAVA